jgi:hypothetical protein
MPALIMNVTRYISGVHRGFVKDIRSNVVCEEIKMAKGVKKGIDAKQIMLDDYMEVLFTGNSQYRKMNMIRKERHDIYTITVNKKALSADDDKRVIMDDGISTKAIGHYSTVNAPSLVNERRLSAGACRLI